MSIYFFLAGRPAAIKAGQKHREQRANELESTIPVIYVCVADPHLRQGRYAPKRIIAREGRDAPIAAREEGEGDKVARGAFDTAQQRRRPHTGTVSTKYCTLSGSTYHSTNVLSRGIGSAWHESYVRARVRARVHTVPPGDWSSAALLQPTPPTWIQLSTNQIHSSL